MKWCRLLKVDLKTQRHAYYVSQQSKTSANE